MTKRLLIHNFNHYLFRLLFLVPLLALMLVQNYELIAILNTYGTAWLLPSSEQYTHYQVHPKLSYEDQGYYYRLNAQNLSDLYQTIKYDFDIIMQYISYSSTEEIFVMDVDYYKREFDPSFTIGPIPCVLEAPQGYKGKEGSRLGPKCGTNTIVASEYDGRYVVDFDRTSVILIDGYLEPKSEGNEMVLYPNRDTLDILISNQYSDEQQQTILADIQNTSENFYAQLDLKGEAGILYKNIQPYTVMALLKDAWHFSANTSIPIILLAIAGIFVLVNLLIQTNRNYIVICTLVSKRKTYIYLPLYISCLIIDLIAVIIAVGLFTPLTDIPIKEAPFITMILTSGLLLIETTIFLIMTQIYRGNKLAMDVRAKESD